VIHNGQTMTVKKAAAEVLAETEEFAKQYAPEFLPDVEYQIKKLNGGRYADIVRDSFRHYITDGLALAKKYRG
ncbi:MAG: hypothetical protein IJ639_01955, partial [Ruminococcus sp.]|nr:hypothetical protein [Ruminococcus sp.]